MSNSNVAVRKMRASKVDGTRTRIAKRRDLERRYARDIKRHTFYGNQLKGEM